MIIDTTFLIDLEREIARGQPGPAMTFLERQPTRTMRISVVTLGEIAEGYEDQAAPGLRELLAPYGIIEITAAIAMRYAAVSRDLRSAGIRTGDNDLWIGVTAMEADEPLVTRDQEHFRRMKGLTVLGY